MFDDLEPLYATISADGGIFTLYYAPNEQYCAASHSGYGPGVFKDAKGIPCVDLRTMDFDGYRYSCVREEHSHFNETDPPLLEFVEDCRRRGATITEL